MVNKCVAAAVLVGENYKEVSELGYRMSDDNYANIDRWEILSKGKNIFELQNDNLRIQLRHLGKWVNTVEKECSVNLRDKHDEINEMIKLTELPTEDMSIGQIKEDIYERIHSIAWNEVWKFQEMFITE